MLSVAQTVLAPGSERIHMPLEAEGSYRAELNAELKPAT
jgi:hypothetical protein